MKFFAKFPNEEVELEFLDSGETTSVRYNGAIRHLQLKRLGQKNLFLLLVDNKSYELYVEEVAGTYDVKLNGRRYRLQLEDEKTRSIRRLIKTDTKQAGRVEIKSPMPGLIVDILVKKGDRIEKGDSLVVIEAMKMENEIRSDISGTVKRILKNARDPVERDTLLMIIE